jgi:hypothetical protein
MQSPNAPTRTSYADKPEPDRNIEELTDDEIYAAIRYLEPDPGSASKQSDDSATTEENDRNGVVICVCLYIALLGCLAVFLVVLEMMLVFGKL